MIDLITFVNIQEDLDWNASQKRWHLRRQKKVKAKNLPLEKCQLTSAKFLSRFYYSQTAFSIYWFYNCLLESLCQQINYSIDHHHYFSMSFFGMILSKTGFRSNLISSGNFLKGPLGFGKIQGATKWRLEINMHDLFTFSSSFNLTNFFHILSTVVLWISWEIFDTFFQVQCHHGSAWLTFTSLWSSCNSI